MKVYIILITTLVTAFFGCRLQKEIFYTFEQPVIDSLQRGINLYSRQLQRHPSALKLSAIIVENNNEFEIYLQEYSHLPKSGILSVLKSTNRKLRLNNKFSIPILIPADIISENISRDKIAAIPLSGYYVKVVYENYKQKVAETAELY